LVIGRARTTSTTVAKTVKTPTVRTPRERSCRTRARSPACAAALMPVKSAVAIDTVTSEWGSR